MADTQKILSCSRNHVYNLIAGGELERLYPRPKMPRITASSINAYLERVRTGAKLPEPSKPLERPVLDAIKAKAGGVRAWLGLGNKKSEG
jgi:hypothetical protein